MLRFKNLIKNVRKKKTFFQEKEVIKKPFAFSSFTFKAPQTRPFDFGFRFSVSTGKEVEETPEIFKEQKQKQIKIEQICAASLRYRKCNRQTCENLGNFGKRESSYRNVDATTISESWFSGNSALFPFSAFTTNDQRKITFRSNFQVSIDNIFKLATNEQTLQQFEFTKHNVVL